MKRGELYMLIHLTPKHNVQSIKSNGLIPRNKGRVYAVRFENPSATVALTNLLFDLTNRGIEEVGVVLFNCRDWVDGYVGTPQEGNSHVYRKVSVREFVSVEVMTLNDVAIKYLDGLLLRDRVENFAKKYPEDYEHFLAIKKPVCYIVQNIFWENYYQPMQQCLRYASEVSK